MSFPPNSMSYSQGFGASPNLVAFPHIDVRAPTASDVLYPIGQRWIDTVANNEWVLTSQSSSAGSLQSNWSQGGNAEATTSDFGVVQLATLSELQNGNAPAGAIVPLSNDVATVIQGIVVGAVPPATETQQGIAEIATQAETDAGVDDTRIVTPLKLANFISSGGTPGDFSTLHASGAVTFDSTLLVSGLASLAGSATVTTGATALNLASDASTGAVNIGTGAGARVITVGNVTGATAVAVNTGTGSFTVTTTGAGDIVLNSDDTMLLDADGVLELNSSAGAIGIGNDADAQAINIGTGAAARTITVGNSTGATSLVLNAGTGAIDIGTNAVAHATTIGNGTGASSVIIESGSGPINIGANAVAHTVTLGNVTGASAVVVNSGTGGIAMASTGAGDIIANSSDTLLLDSAGVLELNSSAGVISIGNDAVAQNINIGTGAAARVITIGNVSGASQVVLNSGTAGVAVNTTGAGDVLVNSADTVLIDSAGVLELNSSGAAISIGNDAVAQPINIGTGAAARTISIGTGAAVVETIAIGGTGANIITIGNTQTAGSVAIGAAMTTGTISIGGTGLQTGTITVGGGTGAQTVNLATGGTGVKTVHIADSAVANVVTLGSTTGAAATTIQAGTGLITMAGKVALNSSAGPQLLAGAGDPNGLVTAPQGSLWMRTDGGASTRLYSNSNSGTAWAAITSA